MNNDMNFKSVDELYIRIKPALYSKVCEFKRLHREYIKEEDIWNYLVENLWKRKKDLMLSEMVSDILELDIDEIDFYVKNMFDNTKRKINKEDTDLL